MRLPTTTVSRRRLLSGSVLALVLTAIATATGSAPAGADAGWSRAPASGIGGGTVQVASSSTTLCQWIQPASDGAPSSGPPDPQPTGTSAPSPGGATTPAGDTIFDGTEVRVRLAHDGLEVPLATFAVAPGGAWAGRITLPGNDVLAPGAYDLFVKCVIDRPELDGVRTYDLDPLPFTVVEAPPPTTVVVPTELVPPITALNPVQVQGEQLSRPATPTAPAGPSTAPTLPNTGDGALETGLSGIGALLVGAAALWWGARHRGQHPGADLID